MGCSHPLYMIKRGLKENGKQDLIFATQVQANLGLSTDELMERYKDRLVPIPCGKCLGCRLDHAKEWAVRCVLESLDHECNSFLTLTYDDAHCPKKLHKSHLSAFLKRLRSRHPDIEIKFFGCGERGSKTNRPHYHVIIFGYDFADKKVLAYDGVSVIYRSDELEKLWTFGISSIGEVTLQSCSYVARYTTKKVNQSSSDEFILMSRRPGIGYKWFMDHKNQVYLSDHVYGNFGNSHKASVPRYFDKLAEKEAIDLLDVKDERVRRAQIYTLLSRFYSKVDAAEALNKTTEDLLVRRIKSLRRYL